MTDWGRALRRALHNQLETDGPSGPGGPSGENVHGIIVLSDLGAGTSAETAVVPVVPRPAKDETGTTGTMPESPVVPGWSIGKSLSSKGSSWIATSATTGTTQNIAARTSDAPVVVNGKPDLQEWWAGVGVLAEADAPPEGFSPGRWDEVVADAWRLLRDYGAVAAFFGWDTLDLFGCHPIVPAARVDCKGLALLMCGGMITSMSDTRAHIGWPSSALLTFRRHGNHNGVPLWEVCRDRL
jgi:hypothetical protein